MAAVEKPSFDKDKAEVITIDDFMTRVLPGVTGMELVLRNSQQNNFMSLTAPVHADVAPLFKWNNNFGWSYDGNITDSIKERVKAQGGKTDAVLRVSLAWFNKDDLDIHVIEPDGHEIYFGNKGQKSRNTGMLDVDMNAYGPHSDTAPVENVVWDRPMDGVYHVVVNNYNKRTSDNPGYTLELESAGQLHQFTSTISPKTGQNHDALSLLVKNGVVTKFEVLDTLTGGSYSQEKWGVATETPVKVSTLMLSPNYWDGNAVGNKHWFFVLDGCKNDQPARGVYNEFLSSGLEKHRKVFELVGEKTKCQPTDDQLSGVGFSSTRGDSVLVSVTGPKLRKTFNITF
jgi:hypothetical protein